MALQRAGSPPGSNAVRLIDGVYRLRGIRITEVEGD
jgi:hypothetical protein